MAKSATSSSSPLNPCAESNTHAKPHSVEAKETCIMIPAEIAPADLCTSTWHNASSALWWCTPVWKLRLLTCQSKFVLHTSTLFPINVVPANYIQACRFIPLDSFSQLPNLLIPMPIAQPNNHPPIYLLWELFISQLQLVHSPQMQGSQGHCLTTWRSPVWIWVGSQVAADVQFHYKHMHAHSLQRQAEFILEVERAVGYSPYKNEQCNRGHKPLALQDCVSAVLVRVKVQVTSVEQQHCDAVERNISE